MILDSKTIEVMKNFALINPNLLINTGSNILKTRSASNTLFAIAEVPNSFDTEIGIYDLNEFLSIIGMIPDADIRFNDSSAEIISNDGRTVVKYLYAAKNMLTIPEKSPNVTDPIITLKLGQNDFTALKRAAGIFGFSYLSIRTDENSIVCEVLDPKNPSTNKFSIKLDDRQNGTAEFNFLISNLANLKFLPLDYTLKFYIKGQAKIAVFEGEYISYYVGVDRSSTYSLN